MNYIKLQQDILKAKFVEDTRGRKSPFAYGFYEESIAIVIDGHYIVFIPTCAFYLDLKKTFPKLVPVNVEKIIKPYDTEPITDTGMIRTVEDGLKVRVFSGKTDQIWIDEKCFKYFGKDEVTEYRGTGKKYPIYLYEYEVLVGMLLPVNHA